MKKINIRALLFVGLVAALVVAVNLQADDYSKQAAAKNTESNRFLVEVPHTVEDCLQSLDATKALGSEKLSNWGWGCMSGDHTAYLIVNAKAEAEALKWVPAVDVSKAKVHKLSVFTAEQIQAFHQMQK